MAENLTQSIDTSTMLLVLLDLLSRDKGNTICTAIAEVEICKGIPCSQCPLLSPDNTLTSIIKVNDNKQLFLQEITPLVETIKLLNTKE